MFLEPDARDPDSLYEQETVTPRTSYRVRPITKAEAVPFILKYEWLQTPGRPEAVYGAIDRITGKLAAVAIFGRPVLTHETPGTIVLERGAQAWWTHPHTASWFINAACRMARADRGWNIFVAFADLEADEIGTVYQAAGWSYMGQSPTRLIGGKPRPRDYFIGPDGREIEDHGFRKRGLAWPRGSAVAVDKLTRAPVPGWRRVQHAAKHRYQWSPDPKLRADFKRRSLPYPKRLKVVPREPWED